MKIKEKWFALNKILLLWKVGFSLKCFSQKQIKMHNIYCGHHDPVLVHT